MLQVAIRGPKCYILGMETVNPLVFNCNDLVYRRVEKLVGKGEYASAMLQVLTDEKALQRKRRLKILPFTRSGGKDVVPLGRHMRAGGNKN